MPNKVDTTDAVLRFTDVQLEEEPGRVVADVARALAQEDWLPMR